MARFVLLVRLIAVRRRMIGKPYLSLRNKQLRMNYVRVFVEVGRIWDLSLRERDSHWFDHILWLDEKKFIFAKGQDKTFVWITNSADLSRANSIRYISTQRMDQILSITI